MMYVLDRNLYDVLHRNLYDVLHRYLYDALHRQGDILFGNWEENNCASPYYWPKEDVSDIFSI